MKITDKKKPIHTIPDSVWESSKPAQNTNRSKSTISTDIQGNGYPDNKQSK